MFQYVASDLYFPLRRKKRATTECNDHPRDRLPVNDRYITPGNMIRACVLVHSTTMNLSPNRFEDEALAPLKTESDEQRNMAKQVVCDHITPGLGRTYS